MFLELKQCFGVNLFDKGPFIYDIRHFGEGLGVNKILLTWEEGGSANA